MSEFENGVFEIARRAVIHALASSVIHGQVPLGKFADEAASRIMGEVEALRRSKRSVKWDQRAVVEWQNKTFGEPRSNLGIAIRANEEMSELLRCLSRDDSDPAARAEVADVVIVLCRLSERLGGTIVRDVDAKMEVNLGRTWRRRGDGHGQHVREPTPSVFAETPEPLCAKCGGSGVLSVPFEHATLGDPCDCRRNR